MRSLEIILPLPTPTDIPDYILSPVAEKRRKARRPAKPHKIFDEARCWADAQSDLSADESPLYNETQAHVAEIDEFATLPDFKGL